MTELNEILSLLEAERERYILEATRLERRLQSIRTQVSAIDNLISGYVQEQQYHQFYQQLRQSQTQAYLEEDKRNHNTVSLENSVETETQISSNIDLASEKFNQVTEDNEAQEELEVVDTSDIPKVKGGRQSDSLAMLPKYEGYSIRNAIIILMRSQPNLHFHINVILRDLYGDNLNKKQYQTARVSVTKALSVGFKSGLWFKVLRERGVYTLKYQKGITAPTPKDK